MIHVIDMLARHWFSIYLLVSVTVSVRGSRCGITAEPREIIKTCAGGGRKRSACIPTGVYVRHFQTAHRTVRTTADARPTTRTDARKRSLLTPPPQVDFRRRTEMRVRARRWDKIQAAAVTSGDGGDRWSGSTRGTTSYGDVRLSCIIRRRRATQCLRQWVLIFSDTFWCFHIQQTNDAVLSELMRAVECKKNRNRLERRSY